MHPAEIVAARKAAAAKRNRQSHGSERGRLARELAEAEKENRKLRSKLDAVRKRAQRAESKLAELREKHGDEAYRIPLD